MTEQDQFRKYTGPDSEPTFGSLIKSFRARQGLLQTDLASRLGVTPSTVCHWERGRQKTIKNRQLLNLKIVLGLDEKDMEGLLASTGRGSFPVETRQATFTVTLENGNAIVVPVRARHLLTEDDLPRIRYALPLIIEALDATKEELKEKLK